MKFKHRYPYILYEQTPFFTRAHTTVKATLSFIVAAILISSLTLFVSPATGQETTFEEASRLAASGKHTAAESIYDQLLQADPNDRKARLGRAHVRSWQGHHQAAQEDFLSILETNPNDVDALTGLGYSLAWSGAHIESEKRFQQALRIDPARLDAEKGLAFASLWRRDAELAVSRFSRITKKAPDDAEAAVGLGQAWLAAGRHRSARRAFNSALDLEPGRKDALEGTEGVRDAPAPLELSLWGGHTFNGGDTGLRTAEIAGWPSPDLRLWVRYDNALSLDNPALVREGEDIPSLYGGVLANWGKRYTTRVEIGRRELPGDVDQMLYQAEHVTYLPQAKSLKIGGLFGPRDDDGDDWNLYAGVGFPYGPRLRIEPTLFYTKSAGVDEHEWRLLLPGDYRFNHGWRLGGGLAWGNIDSEVPGASGNLWAAHVLAIAPVGEAHRAHLLLRHEAPANAPDFTVIGIGITFRLERN